MTFVHMSVSIYSQLRFLHFSEFLLNHLPFLQYSGDTKLRTFHDVTTHFLPDDSDLIFPAPSTRYSWRRKYYRILYIFVLRGSGIEFCKIIVSVKIHSLCKYQ